jgi:hypothetical protein
MQPPFIADRVVRAEKGWVPTDPGGKNQTGRMLSGAGLVSTPSKV